MTGPRILLLGNDPATLDILASLARCTLGTVEVERATRPQEALKWISEREYRVVVCESALAGMTGREFAIRLLDLRPRPTVVLLTPDDSPEGVADEVVYAQVPTPVCFRAFSAVLERALELNRLEREAERSRAIRHFLKSAATYGELLRTQVIEAEARMANLREQQRAEANGTVPADYEAAFNDQCFGWAVETNLLYSADFGRRHRKEVA